MDKTMDNLITYYKSTQKTENLFIMEPRNGSFVFLCTASFHSAEEEIARYLPPRRLHNHGKPETCHTSKISNSGEHTRNYQNSFCGLRGVITEIFL